MSLGTLELNIMMLGIDRVKSDMDSLKGSIGGAMEDVEKYMGMAKTALMGLTGVASIEGFKTMVDGSIKSAAALEGLAMQAGMSGEALSGLARVGKLSGTSAEDVADSMNKLQRAMAASDDDTKKVGRALADIGLNFDDFKKLQPEEQMIAVGKAMNNFADGTGKSQVAMDLFGKSGAKQIEYLRDLGEAEGIHSKYTNEQIALSEQYEKDMRRLTASGADWKDQLAMGMLPALETTVKASLDLMNGSNGLRDEIKRLADDGSIKQFTQNAITGLTYVMDAFSGVMVTAKSAGLILGGVAAAVTSGSWDGMKAVIQGVGEDLEKTWGEQTLGSRLRDRIAEFEKTGGAIKTNGDQVHHAAAANKELTDEIDRQGKMYAQLMASVDAKIMQGETELGQSTKLTDAQKIQAKLFADIDEGILKLTADEYLAIDAKIDHLDAVNRHNLAMKEEKALQDQIAKDRDADIAKLYEHTAKMQDDNDKLVENNLRLTMSSQEYTRHQEKLLLDQAATLELIAATSDQSDELKKQAQILRDRAGLLEEGIVLKEAKAVAVEWEKTTKQIGDGLSGALVDAVASGRDVWLTFRDYMVRTIIDGAIKNALSSVIQAGLGAFDSAMGGMVSSALSRISAAAGVSLAGGGAAAAGASALGAGAAAGSADAYAAAAAGGGSATIEGTLVGIGNALGLGGESAAAAGSADAFVAEAAGSAAAAEGITLASALPVVGAVVLGAAVLNSIFGGGGTPTANTGNASMVFDPTGKQIDYQTFYGGSNAQTDSVITGMEASYLSSARQLGITPTTTQFSYGGNTGAGGAHPNFALGGGVAGGMNSYTPETTLTSAAVQDASTKAIVAALRGSATTPEQLAAIAAQFPGYAHGGEFAGGWRLVGERGPELEATGPSRIFNADQTASIMNGGDAKAEVAALRADQQAQSISMANLMQRFTRIIERWEGQGMPPVRPV